MQILDSWCSSVLITFFGLLLLQQPLQAENDRIVFELQRKREQEKEAEQERLRELASSISASEIIQ
jgi:putative Mn2+ efflux pump MntP